uniref:peroxisomal NADH pyrophosphatase NUDT12 isoform X1 n=1 Tax=Ciona intestinalis TaxID=7719 RepID=UPI00006A519E|nr:peroxisomal NADH pyrophosphatase NUDT12 isoform X1 [Ciona intestinalis]|eukprot:XP_009858585.1 peroxisomal NADH pyrophosphatase NUDT12 isoform X1 [Ciona intestinalis]
MSGNSNAQKYYIDEIFTAAANGDVEAITKGYNMLSISPDVTDKMGWTPLMCAARNGHVNVMGFLLQQGADPKHMNKSGQTALDVASFWNQTGSVNFLNGFLKPNKSPVMEVVHYFGFSALDRQSYQRSDENEMKKAMRMENAKYVVFADLQLLVSNDAVTGKSQNVVYLTWGEIEKYLSIVDHDLIFLGVGNIDKGLLVRETHHAQLNDSPYFAVNFKKMPSDDEFSPEKYNGSFTDKDNRRLMMMLQKNESGLVAQARSVLAWHERYNFCPTCGNETIMKDFGYKRLCISESCTTHKGAHNTSFPRTDPVVIILVASKDGSKCLLGRQSRFPRGMYSCIAGFMEPGESIEDAARREVFEESGVKVGQVEYHSSQPWPFPSNIMIGLIGRAVCDDINVDKVELEDARWFDKPEVAKAILEGFGRKEGLVVPPHTAIAHHLIKTWVQRNSNSNL